MLLYPPIKELLSQVPSRYMLVNLVASRARKLSSEAEVSGEPLEEKAVSLAIREVAAGTLTVEGAQGSEEDAAEEFAAEIAQDNE
ncbi:MAG: DNA-directed RNA polymerase subunit omega [Oscillospiraceae bacterium]|nr:DNA-directed RNA polymerase subunit omega [Oscillospiraceae bacterium]